MPSDLWGVRLGPRRGLLHQLGHQGDLAGRAEMGLPQNGLPWYMEPMTKTGRPKNGPRAVFPLTRQDTQTRRNPAFMCIR